MFIFKINSFLFSKKTDNWQRSDEKNQLSGNSYFLFQSMSWSLQPSTAING